MLRLLNPLRLLLAPLAAAWDQEFGGRSIAPQQPAEPPAPQPRPTPLPEPEPQPATSPTAESEFSAAGPELSATEQQPECDATRGPASATPDVAAPVTPAEPLYVRRGAGRGARYDVASPDAEGQRYRRQVKGRRTEYTPVEAGR